MPLFYAEIFMSDIAKQANEYLVISEQDGLRLDQVLAATWPEHSRAFFQKCVADGNVLLNNSKASSSRRVKSGDCIQLFWPPPVDEELTAEEIPLDILFEDDDILLINKPPGLVVHPGSGNISGTLVHGLLFHDQEAFSEMLDEEQRPGIVHRLDKDTSGVLVVAKNPSSERALKESFKSRRTVKVYLALVVGRLQPAIVEIKQPIGRSPGNRRKMAVLEQGGKEALSKCRLLAATDEASLLEVEILTGRTHQIRVHLASIQHPVLGDLLYGRKKQKVPFLPERQLLHAWKLTFPHPKTGKSTHCMAPVPEDFRAAMQALQLKCPI